MRQNNLTLAELHAGKPANENRNFRGVTEYSVKGKSYDVAPWNHPSLLVNKILSWIQHTHFYALSVIAPPGSGKSSMAQTLIHGLHLQRPDFNIIHAGPKEFSHQKEFYQSLPKRPTIIRFEDISAAFAELSDREIEMNFEALSTVRWILDPIEGRIPVIMILEFHYSKKVVKSVRAQFSTNVFCALTQEERTNLQDIAEKGSPSFTTLKNFGWIYSRMFEDHKFTLPMPTGSLTYETDKPFRVAAALTRTNAYLVLYTNQDVCDYCAKKKTRRVVPAREIYERVRAAHGKHGVAALRIALFRKGKKSALHPRTGTALEFVERKVFGNYETDEEELIKIIYGEVHQKVPKRTYHKRKVEGEILSALDNEATVEELPPPTEKEITTSPAPDFPETLKQS